MMARHALAVALFVQAGIAYGVPVSTRTHAVTVFPAGARVVRTGTVRLAGGHQPITLSEVPASIDESSIRLSAAGPAGMKLSGIQIHSEATPDEVNQRRSELEKRIRELEDRRDDLADRISARTAEADLLKAMGGKAADRAGNGTGGDFTGPAAAAGRRLAALLVETRKDERARRELTDQVEALRRDLARMGQGVRSRRSIEADIEMPQDGEAVVSLEYQVEGASWTPVYDVRLESTGTDATVAIGFGALVRQSSGEDWSDVQLSLSTMRPVGGGVVPDPTNWWLDLWQPQPVRAYRKSSGMAAAPSMMRSQAMDSAGAAETEVPVQAQSVEAETVHAEFSTTFRVPRPTSIPSGGDSRRVGVSESKHPATVALVTVPRLLPMAIVEAEVRYAGEAPLMPGPANLYRGSDFAGAATLAAAAPGELLHLGFGPDENLKVERKPMKLQAGAGGFFSRAGRSYRWVTTIHNFHDGKRTIEVREQLPRSRRKEIEVSVTELLPPPMPEDPERPGLVRWQIEIPAKSDAKATFAYAVKYPEGTQVTGLE